VTHLTELQKKYVILQPNLPGGTFATGKVSHDKGMLTRMKKMFKKSNDRLAADRFLPYRLSMSMH
jgi:hypothetical protein